MTKDRRRRQPSQEPQQTRTTRWPQIAALIGVALLVAAILILKDRSADPPAAAESEPQATARLHEAVSHNPAAATPQVLASAVPDELPEAQLDRLLDAGQATFAFFHSDNCVQCIKMMEVVEEVYPQFADSVALLDVNVYDKANSRLLQRAQIRAIPTQIFIDRTGQGTVVMGAMTPDQFREQMQTLVGGQ